MANAKSELSEEIGDIRKELSKYKPGSTVENPGFVEFPKNLTIGLFGRTGCGKTSLINSLRFAAKGNLRESRWLHAAGQEKAGGHTMFRKKVDITKRISVVDNRGMDNLHAEAALTELLAQLAGTRGYSEIVTWDGSSHVDCEQLGDRIATAVFVFSAVHNIEENLGGLSQLISAMHNTQGQYPIAVITHVDEVGDGDLQAIKALLRTQGISDSCIFTVANLTKNNKKLQEKYQHNLLSLLDRCLFDGDQAMIYHYHQHTENQRRDENERRLRNELREREQREEELEEMRRNELRERERREEELKEIIRQNQREMREANEFRRGRCAVM